MEWERRLVTGSCHRTRAASRRVHAPRATLAAAASVAALALSCGTLTQSTSGVLHTGLAADCSLASKLVCDFFSRTAWSCATKLHVDALST